MLGLTGLGAAAGSGQGLGAAGPLGAKRKMQGLVRDATDHLRQLAVTPCKSGLDQALSQATAALERIAAALQAAS